MAALTEMDILRTEHQLLSEMEMMAAADPTEIRDAFMRAAGINAMAYELLEKLKKKENGDGK